MEVLAGPGITGLGESLHLIDMLAVLLILPIIALGMNMETGIFLIHLAGEVGKRAGTILYERQDVMASVSTGGERLKIMLTVRVVTLTR